MPSQSETLGAQAGAQARENLIYRTNVMLRENINRIRLLLRTNPGMFAASTNLTPLQQSTMAHLMGNAPLTDEEYAGLATELVDRGTVLGLTPAQITFTHNGQSTNLAE